MGNAHCTVVNQTLKPVCVITFNMTDPLTKFYKTLYIVEPGESTKVEANPDAIGLRLGFIYDTKQEVKEILFYRFSCHTDTSITITSLDKQQIHYFGSNITQQANGKLTNFSSEPFLLVLNTLNAEPNLAPPSSPSNPRSAMVRMRKNSVIGPGSYDEATKAEAGLSTPATTSTEFSDVPAIYRSDDLEAGKPVAVPIAAILSSAATVSGICSVIQTNAVLRKDQEFPVSLFEDFLVLNATLTSIAAFHKTCVVSTGTQVASVDLVYFGELVSDATKFAQDSTRDISTLTRRYQFLFNATTIKTINKRLIDELLLPLTVRAFTSVSIHLQESEEQTRSVVGKLQASMDTVIRDMCSESVNRMKAQTSTPEQMFRKRSATRDAPEPAADPVWQQLQSRVGHACEAIVDGAQCTRCVDYGFDITAKFTPLSPQSTRCSFCSCEVSCHTGGKIDKASIEARQAAQAAAPRSALGMQRRESRAMSSPEKVNPALDLQHAVGRTCSGTVDGAPCNKCADFGFEITPRYTPLSPQSTKCGLCSCDVSCHDGPVVVRA